MAGNELNLDIELPGIQNWTSGNEYDSADVGIPIPRLIYQISFW